MIGNSVPLGKDEIAADLERLRLACDFVKDGNGFPDFDRAVVLRDFHDFRVPSHAHQLLYAAGSHVVLSLALVVCGVIVPRIGIALGTFPDELQSVFNSLACLSNFCLEYLKVLA